MTILDFLNKAGTKNFKRLDGEIGLEIETETKSHESYPPGFLVADPNGRNLWTAPSLKYWDVHVDGSLRDFGLEYVLKQPLKFKKEIPDALEEFRDKTSKVKFIKDSITTSVHVHLNVLNESFKTLGNFLTLYTLFENLLIRYSGPDRLSNLFCLPICDAEDTYKNIISMMNNAQMKAYKSMMLAEANVKYAALNLGAFNTYGSVEIRSFRGETDTKAIQNWISILYAMMEYSRRDVSPKDIMLSWREKQGKFLNDVFTDHRKELARSDELELIDKNIWYAGSIAYSVKNWNALDEVVKSPEFKPKQKDLEAVSVSRFSTAWINLDHAQQDWVLKYLKTEHEKKYFIKTPILNGWEENVAVNPAVGRMNQAGQRVVIDRNDRNAGFRWNNPAGDIPAPAGEVIPDQVFFQDQPDVDRFGEALDRARDMIRDRGRDPEVQND